MFSSTKGTGGGGAASTDPYFKNTTLLLKGDTASPTLTYTAFSDASSNAFPITSNGDAYGSSFSPYNVGWSNYFDGTGDYLTTSTNSGFPMTGDFTIETWVYPSAPPVASVIIEQRQDNIVGNGYWQLSYSSSLGLSFTYDGDVNAINAGTLTANTWNHIAATRTGSTISLYLNGVRQGQATSSATVGRNDALWIGAQQRGGPLYYAIGYLSNIRIIDGTNVYGSGTTLTVPTAPLTAISGTSLLTCQSNRFIDNSSNNFAITKNGDVAVKSFSPFTDTDTTTGSGYFDGAGDYLSVPDNAVFDLLVGTNWTIESWFYKTAAGQMAIIGSNTYPAGSTNFSVAINSSNQYQFNWVRSPGNQVDVFSITSSSTVTLNQWNHVAAVNSGGTVTMYVNGSSVGSVALSGTFVNHATGIGIGSYSADGVFNAFAGYISNARIVVGTAAYTSNFTPPTTSLEAITNTKLLTLQTRGATQNIGIIDSSPNRFPITRVGNATQGTFSPYGSLWSNYFDGSGDYLTFPSNTVFEIGASDNFTIECWVNFYGSGSDKGGFFQSTTDISSAVGPIWFGYLGGSLYCSRHGSGAYAVSYSWAPSLGTWYHVAATRSSGTTRLFIDGVLVQTSTLQNNIAFTQNGAAVGVVTTPSYFNGFLSNVRFIKGTALYTSNFTPSTTPLTAVSGTSLLTCQSNRFKDNSSNNFTLTVNGNTSVQRFSPFNPTAPYSASTIGGSGYFDGTGDYLSVPYNSALDFGSGDFTVEGWWYINSLASEMHPVSFNADSPTGASQVGWVIYINGSANEATLASGSTYYSITGWSSYVKVGKWQHFAYCRQSGTVRLYLDGFQIGTVSANVAVNSSSSWATRIGSYTNSSRPFNGYLSDVRIIKGACQYPSGTTFTPPTAPLTAITNTSLLCNFTNAGIIDNAGKNNLETVGNAQVSTTVKKYGTGSLAFDGTGDYLITPSSSLYTLGSSAPFTIEGWFYLAASQTTDSVLLSTMVNWSSDYVNRWAITATGTTIKWYNSAGSVTISSSVSSGQWVHIAVCNTGSTITMYINGASVGTQTTNLAYTTDGSLKVGGGVTGATNFNGYIDDLRITKGYARYTANFTLPTQALPTN